jgi:hypothetical protein
LPIFISVRLENERVPGRNAGFFRANNLDSE